MSEKPDMRGLFKPPFPASGKSPDTNVTGDHFAGPSAAQEPHRGSDVSWSSGPSAFAQDGRPGNSGLRQGGMVPAPNVERRIPGTGPLNSSGAHSPAAGFHPPSSGFNAPPPGFAQASPRTDAHLQYGPPPPGFGSMPPGTGTPPPGFGSMPPGFGSMPPGTGTMPPGFGSMPPGTGMPPGFGSMPPGTGTPPPGFGSMSPGGTPPPGFYQASAATLRASQPLVLQQSAPPNGPAGSGAVTPDFRAPSIALRDETNLSKRRSRVILAILIFVLAMPSLASMAEMIHMSVMAFHTYSGATHLLDVKNIFTGSHGHLTTALLDPNNLSRADNDLVGARNELQYVSDMLNQDVVFTDIGTVFPEQIATIRALAKIGVDATDMGQKLVDDAKILAPSFQGNVLAADNKKPVLTPQVLALASDAITYMLPLLSDVQTQTGSLALNTLPFINAQQRDQLAQAIQALPMIRSDLAQAHDLMDAIGWLGGVDHPRTLLIETMDRSELRPTGGFTGQYGELSIDAGRVAPFSLQNIGLYEENNPNALSNGQAAPAPFTWWPIGNWGLRDSNLSSDLPTSAKLVMQTYAYEFGHQLDGVILFSPFLIQDVLRVTGPIVLPQYNETITSQNLEQRLHYYQLDNTGIRTEELVEHVEDPALARKAFTSRVSKMLMDQLRSAPPDILLGVASAMLRSLRTKNLQLYVTNPAIENLLLKYDSAATIDRSDKYDGLYVVQANISASKASQYTRAIMHDTVTLDASGGATHVLQLRLVYNQLASVYGLDTYHDYVRIYIPPNSRYLWGDGFEQQGQPYCGGDFDYCPTYDVYHNGDLLCPAGLNDSGFRTSTLGDPYAKKHPLMVLGDPTNMVSDESGRAMLGGWIVVPKNCSATATLSWYVPAMGQGVYSLKVQRQADTFPELDLTVLSTVGGCVSSSMYYNNILSGPDQSFTLKTPAGSSSAGCMAQPGV